jgi:hypothetical protein
MKKIYLLASAALLSVAAFGQTSEAGKAVVNSTKTFSYVASPERLLSPDTTGLVNFLDFLPEFAPGGQAVIYGYTGGGFIYGNNVSGNNLRICAQGYDNLNNIPVNIVGALLWFGGKESDGVSAPTSRIAVQTYNVVPNRSRNTNGSGAFNSTVNNWPGPAAGAASQTVDLLFVDVDTMPGMFNYVSFPTVATFVDDFALVMDVTNLSAGDTVGLVSDQEDDASELDYTWHKIGANWYVTDQLFSPAAAPDFGTGGLNNNIALWAVVEDATGVNEFFNGMKLTTYPNPAVEQVTIEYTLEQNANGVSLMIFDQSGRKVLENTYSQQNAGTYKATVNTSDLAAGTYFYQLRSNGHMFTKQFVVTK